MLHGPLHESHSVPGGFWARQRYLSPVKILCTSENESVRMNSVAALENWENSCLEVPVLPRPPLPVASRGRYSWELRASLIKKLRVS